MSSLLLVESGSTKTDWCFIQKGKKNTFFKTAGINPNLQKSEDIVSILDNELKWNKKIQPGAVIYYGAGTGNEIKRKELKHILTKYFATKNVDVNTDLMAAAKALCGNTAGIVCILGTGSNSCYYNGKTIKDRKPSLGYIAGDEGSGNYMGKRVLQYYAYNTFDTELTLSFEQHFGNDINKIIYQLYHEPFPNRYLAGFTRVLMENRGHFMVENIVEDCLNDFFHSHILKYRQSWKLPINFTGTIAYRFRDVIEYLCDQYELEYGRILQSPIESLVQYHKKNL